MHGFPILIPGTPQRLWGWPAVLNFTLGGLGAGLYVMAAAGAGFAGAPAVIIASWLGPVLVVAGLAAVATEAGRPLRGARLVTRFATSWMSREAVFAGAFVLLALLEFATPGPRVRVLAALAALAFAAAQGFIVRRARGVAAWDVAVMPALFVVGALVSGGGLRLLLEVLAGRRPGGGALGTTMFLVTAAAVVWLMYVTWSDEPAFTESTGVLRDGPTATSIVALGYVAPFALAGVAYAAPAVGAPAAALAGILIVAAQCQLKTALILRAGRLRPVTLATLRLVRRSP